MYWASVCPLNILYNLTCLSDRTRVCPLNFTLILLLSYALDKRLSVEHYYNLTSVLCIGQASVRWTFYIFWHVSLTEQAYVRWAHLPEEVSAGAHPPSSRHVHWVRSTRHRADVDLRERGNGLQRNQVCQLTYIVTRRVYCSIELESLPMHNAQFEMLPKNVIAFFCFPYSFFASIQYRYISLFSPFLNFPLFLPSLPLTLKASKTSWNHSWEIQNCICIMWACWI